MDTVQAGMINVTAVHCKNLWGIILSVLAKLHTTGNIKWQALCRHSISVGVRSSKLDI